MIHVKSRHVLNKAVIRHTEEIGMPDKFDVPKQDYIFPHQP